MKDSVSQNSIIDQIRTLIKDVPFSERANRLNCEIIIPDALKYVLVEQIAHIEFEELMLHTKDLARLGSSNESPVPMPKDPPSSIYGYSVRYTESDTIKFVVHTVT